MQQKRDYLDEIIEGAFKDIEVREEYNEKLISRLNSSKNIKPRRSYTAAISLLVAGIMLFATYTTGFQAKVIGAEYRIKAELYQITNDYGINSLLMGE